MDTKPQGGGIEGEPNNQPSSHHALIGTIVVALIGALGAITVALIGTDSGQADTVTAPSDQAATTASSSDPSIALTTTTASQPAEHVVTIRCPTAGSRFGTEVPVVRGSAEISRLGSDQELWLVAWSESPEGPGSAAYPHSRITSAAWEIQDVTIASPDEPEGSVELRVYALSADQGREIVDEYDANVSLVYLTEDELPEGPEASVRVTRNASQQTPDTCG